MVVGDGEACFWGLLEGDKAGRRQLGGCDGGVTGKVTQPPRYPSRACTVHTGGTASDDEKSRQLR